jgi:hypothetical protein
MSEFVSLDDLERMVAATAKPPRKITTACPCGLGRVGLEHLAACPAVMPAVRAWAKRRLERPLRKRRG